MTFYQDFRSPTESLKRHLKSLFYGVVGATLLVPFILFMAMFQLPIYLYRLVITKLVAPFYRPRIGKAVTVAAQFQATEFLEDNLKTCKTFRYWIVTYNVFNGDISLGNCRKLILDRWVNARKNNEVELCYPEFQQYIDYWMGFMFWKQDSNFDINNHIIYHELDKSATPEHSDRYVCQLTENLLCNSYPPKRSPWEVHVIRNYKSDEFEDSRKQTVLLLRCHHAMADGFSIIHLVLEGLFGGNVKNARIPLPHKSGSNHFAAKLSSALFSPLRFLMDFGFFISMFWIRESPWKPHREVKNGLTESCSSYIYHKSPFLPLEKLKYIKNNFGVNLSAVIFSCLSAAILKSINGDEWTHIRASTMLRTSGHTGKLRNLTLPTIIELDTRQHLNSKDRLWAMNEYFRHARQSFVPHIISCVGKLLSGSLANSFARVPNWGNVPVSISNFPGPQTEIGLDRELQLVGFNTALGAFADMVFMTASYMGNIRIHLTADGSVLDRSQVERIIEDFLEELNTLHQIAAHHEVLEQEVV